MKTKTLKTIFILTFISTIACNQPKFSDGFDEVFNGTELSKYQRLSFLKPSYLEADFTGDGIKDVALLIVDKATRKRGILLIHGNSDQHFVLGAGTKFGNGSDNFKWLKGWNLYTQKTAYETTFNKDGDMLGSKKSLIRPALYVHNLEDGQPTAGGLIYWTGTKYIWIHQGE